MSQREIPGCTDLLRKVQYSTNEVVLQNKKKRVKPEYNETPRSNQQFGETENLIK